MTPMVTMPDWRSASEHHSRLTLRSSVDCLIAACAIRHDLEAMHRDRDYAGEGRLSYLSAILRLHVDDTAEVTRLEYDSRGKPDRVVLPDTRAIAWG
jgi:hypothetical protein